MELARVFSSADASAGLDYPPRSIISGRGVMLC